MSDDQSSLDRETSLVVAVEGNGLNLKAKSRAVSAVDGLIGAFIDAPTAWLEGFGERQRAKNKARRLAIERAGEAVLDRIASDEEAAIAVLRDGELGEIAQKVLKRRAVLNAAAEEYKLLPAPPLEQQEKIEESPDTLDPEWLNLFRDYVDRASPERIKQMWARVLAGEIQRPGAFSFSTMRFIAELSTETAKLFEKFSNNLFLSDMLFLGANLKGDELIEFVTLEQEGLISQAGSALTSHLTSGEDKFINIRLDQFVVMLATINPRMELSFDVYPLTRVGKELLSVLQKRSKDDMNKFAKTIADSVRPNLVSAACGRISKGPNGNLIVVDTVEV